MGITSRFFGSAEGPKDPEHVKPPATAGPDAFAYNGRVTDLQEAQRLAEQERWADALAIIDRLCPIPDDTNVAIDQLKRFLETSDSKIELSSNEMGHDAEGRTLVKTRMGLGPGLLPDILELRGRCINGALFELLREGGATGDQPGRSQEPRALKLAQRGIDHALLVWGVLPNNSDALGISGLLLHGIGRFDAAVQFFECAVQLDASNVIARDMLRLARQRQKEYGENFGL
jgi:hypothetical protein